MFVKTTTPRNELSIECFTSLDPAQQESLRRLHLRRLTQSWFLFTSEGSSMPGHDWTHRYELEFYAKPGLWVVTFADLDTRAARMGAAQVAAWCEAGPDADPALVATALLSAWRDSLMKYPGPGIEYYHRYGELELPYDQFRVSY